jgi:DNA-binding transcriptional ArsR family regulator
MRDLMELFKALADESRLRLLFALKGGELCVCQLIALLELAPSTVSKHLSILRSARLLESRKEGRWMYYRQSEEFRSHSAGKILGLTMKDLEGTKRIAQDRKRLKQITDEGMDHLCRRLFGKP